MSLAEEVTREFHILLKQAKKRRQRGIKNAKRDRKLYII